MVPALPAMPNSEANGECDGTRMQELEAHLGENLYLIMRSPGSHSKFEWMSCHCSTKHPLIQRSDTLIDCRILTCKCPVDPSSWVSSH